MRKKVPRTPFSKKGHELTCSYGHMPLAAAVLVQWDIQRCFIGLSQLVSRREVGNVKLIVHLGKIDGKDK
jgi:hypothetical protein